MPISQNPNYLINFYSANPPVDVTANIPEQINIGVRSHWEQRFPATVQQIVGELVGMIPGHRAASIVGAISKGGTAAFNFNAMIQQLSWLLWTGSSPLELNFNLLFDAEKDGFTDVVKPILDLQRLVMPYQSGLFPGILYPPGPSLANPDRAKCSLAIGNLMFIDSVIVTSANASYDTRMERNGKPIAGHVEVTVSTLFVPSREDLLAMFGVTTDLKGNLIPIGNVTDSGFSGLSPSAAAATDSIVFGHGAS